MVLPHGRLLLFYLLGIWLIWYTIRYLIRKTHRKSPARGAGPHIYCFFESMNRWSWSIWKEVVDQVVGGQSRRHTNLWVGFPRRRKEPSVLFRNATNEFVYETHIQTWWLLVFGYFPYGFLASAARHWKVLGSGEDLDHCSDHQTLCELHGKCPSFFVSNLRWS